MKRITVLLADDRALVRDGLRTFLEAEEDIEVVGTAKNGRQAVSLTHKLHPAVVLMDIAMPVLNGLEATRMILKSLPRTKVIILSAHGDDAYVEQARELGAAGYVLKQSPPRLLPKAVRDVQKGRMVFCPANSFELRFPTKRVWKATGRYPGPLRRPRDPASHTPAACTFLPRR
jgi:DNA-binding NarL/FixJ family response regulator